VARLRAIDDPIAARLVGVAAPNPTFEALRAHVVLRSRRAEERLARAVERGVRQYVILGAGYDTFAYRQPAWASELAIFEVDHEATQQDKRTRLDAAHFALPSNLRFVPADFATHSLAEMLEGADFNVRQSAFFSWLGVTMYLPDAAVNAVLAFVAQCASGSEIVFTFARPQSQGSATALRAQSHGEPFQTFYTESEIENKLDALGYTEIEFLAPGIVTARITR